MPSSPHIGDIFVVRQSYTHNGIKYEIPPRQVLVNGILQVNGNTLINCSLVSYHIDRVGDYDVITTVEHGSSANIKIMIECWNNMVIFADQLYIKVGDASSVYFRVKNTVESYLSGRIPVVGYVEHPKSHARDIFRMEERIEKMKISFPYEEYLLNADPR